MESAIKPNADFFSKYTKTQATLLFGHVKRMDNSSKTLTMLVSGTRCQRKRRIGWR